MLIFPACFDKMVDNYLEPKKSLRKVIAMKKKELCIFAGILLFAALLWIGMTLYRHSREFTGIRITVNGTEFGVYSLEEAQIIDIGTGNICEIREGKVKMTFADCPDKLCMKQPAVDENGGSIICLPHQVVIEGIASSGSEILPVDGIS